MMRYAIAAAAAISCFEISPSHAQVYGDAPWCAVVEETDGDVIWLCQYHSVEECQPNVIAGNRGFCNVNPYGSQVRAALQATPATRRRHHAPTHTD